MNPIRVLLIDDDPGVRQLLTLALQTGGVETSAAADGIDALLQLERWRPDVIVLDLRMPRMDGREFHARMRALGHRMPVLILSSDRPATAARQLEAASYLGKPFHPDQLVAKIRQLAPSAA
jgi:DNA-binding response OmpR family regulator